MSARQVVLFSVVVLAALVPGFAQAQFIEEQFLDEPQSVTDANLPAELAFLKGKHVWHAIRRTLGKGAVVDCYGVPISKDHLIDQLTHALKDGWKKTSLPSAIPEEGTTEMFVSDDKLRKIRLISDPLIKCTLVFTFQRSKDSEIEPWRVGSCVLP